MTQAGPLLARRESQGPRQGGLFHGHEGTGTPLPGRATWVAGPRRRSTSPRGVARGLRRTVGLAPCADSTLGSTA